MEGMPPSVEDMPAEEQAINLQEEITAMLEQGVSMPDIIKGLAERGFSDEEIIEVLVSTGVPEEEVVTVMNQMSEGSQEEMPPAEGEEQMVEGPPPPQAMPPQAMPPEMAMGMPQPMMEDGGEDPVPGTRDFTTHFTNAFSPNVLREQPVYDPSTDPNLTKTYMTDKDGNITGQTYVRAGKTYNTRKLNKLFQKGKIPGESFYDGQYREGGEGGNNPYGADVYKDIELIYPDGSIQTQSLNEKMFKSGYIDYKKPVKKNFSDGTSKTQYRYNPKGIDGLPRVNYNYTGSVQYGGEELPEARTGMGLDRDQQGLAGKMLKYSDGSLNQFFSDRDGYRANPLADYTPVQLDEGTPGEGLMKMIQFGQNLFSGDIDPETGFMKGSFRDRKRKNKAQKDALASTYDYNVKFDPNDPNKPEDYHTSYKSLYEASQGEMPLRTKDQFKEDVQKYSRIDFDPESQRYNTFFSDREIDFENVPSKYREDLQDRYNKSEELSKFVGRVGSLTDEDKTKMTNIGKDLVDFQSNQDMPEDTKFGVDESGNAVYYNPNLVGETGTQNFVDNTAGYMSGNKFFDFGGLDGKKAGGSFDNEGFRALPEKVQMKIMKAQNGNGEERGFVEEDLNIPQPKMDAYMNYLDQKAAHEKELQEVQAIRQNIGQRATDLGTANASPSEVGLSSSLVRSVDELGFGCNTYSCQIARDAGVTIPDGAPPVTINKRTYEAGDKLPMIPGNAQFNSYATKYLGFELLPKGTLPTEPGDLGRGHIYNQGPGGPSSGSQHSYILGTDGKFYNNPGNVTRGYMEYDHTPTEQYYTTDSGVMRYVRNLPATEKAMNEALAAYEALPEDQLRRLKTLQPELLAGAADTQPGALAQMEYKDVQLPEVSKREMRRLKKENPELYRLYENPELYNEQQKAQALIQYDPRYRQMIDASITASRQYGGGDIQMNPYQELLMNLQQRKNQLNPLHKHRVDFDSVYKKRGGQTVDLDINTIAKLISAGADIKIL